MFGENRFTEDEDFSIYYKKIGGQLSSSEINATIRRDLGGPINAGIDCVLVGGAKDIKALASFENLLEFSNQIITSKIVYS